jgi:hypothetical protein
MERGRMTGTDAMSIDVEALAREMRYHARLKGRDTTSDYVLGWDDATTILLARLVPAEDEPELVKVPDLGDSPSYFVKATVPAEDEGRLREALIATLKRDDLCDPDGEHHTDEYVARFLVALDTETQGRAALAATPEPRTTGWATNTLAPTPSRDDEPSPLPTPEPQT